MVARLPVTMIARTMHPYPTLSEGVFWAAEQAAGQLAASPVRA